MERRVSMKVLLAGGGTAGHINPAIAIANEIKNRRPDAQFLFVGTPWGMENDLVPKAGYPIEHITVKGFQRREWWKNFDTAACLMKSFGQTKKLFQRFQPDLVIGTGGYVSGPVLYVGAKRGCKTAIHEGDAFPGLTTRILEKYVDKVMISFDESRQYFKHPEKLVLTGNPVREEFLHADQKRARRELGIGPEPFLLSVGGSLGALKINQSIQDFILENCKTDRYWHYHGAGKDGYSWLPGKLKEGGVRLEEHPRTKIQPYIYNMPTVMAACDLMVCRCGAVTLTELELLGKPAILIPSPNVTNNHQYHNARALSDKGAAVLLEEKDLTPQKLTRTIRDLLDHPEKLEAMSREAKKLAIPDSNQRIYDLVTSL